jgi:hypothetical protein
MVLLLNTGNINVFCLIPIKKLLNTIYLNNMLAFKIINGKFIEKNMSLIFDYDDNLRCDFDFSVNGPHERHVKQFMKFLVTYEG